MNQVPGEFMCPITTSIMSDPVIGSDGHTYERSAITEWLKTHTTSPITRQSMSLQDLRPNHSLKSMIQRFNATPAVTVVPVQPKKHPPPKQKQQKQQSQQQSQSQAQVSLINNDHYYAISVFQEDALRQKPPVPVLVQSPVTAIATAPNQGPPLNKKNMAIICTVFIVIIIMIFIFRQFE